MAGRDNNHCDKQIRISIFIAMSKGFQLILFFLAAFFAGNSHAQDAESPATDYISNHDYHQFTNWVRDSIARKIVSEEMDERFGIYVDDQHQEIDPPRINWKPKIEWRKSRISRGTRGDVLRRI